MEQAEYDALARRKVAAAAEHRSAVTRRRAVIAKRILADPERALRHAYRTLARKTAPQQLWSREAWTDLLQRTAPAEWAELLTNPPADSEALADSHPFGGLIVTSHGH